MKYVFIRVHLWFNQNQDSTPGMAMDILCLSGTYSVHESRFTNHDLDINIPCLYKHTFILLGGPDPAANFVKLAREKG